MKRDRGNQSIEVYFDSDDVEDTVPVTKTTIPVNSTGSVAITIPLNYGTPTSAVKKTPRRSDRIAKSKNKDFEAFLKDHGGVYDFIDLVEKGGDLGEILSENSFICALIDNGEIRLGKQLGKGTYGKVKEVIFPSDSKDYVVKESLGGKIPKGCLTKDQTFVPKNNGNGGDIIIPKGSLLCIDTVSEFYMGLLAADLLRKNVSINFIDVIYFGVCRGHFIRQYTFMERVSSSLASIKDDLSESQIDAIYIQILHAIAVYQRKYKIVHGDLHMGNVLVDRSPDVNAKYLEYVIDGTSLYIPSNGYTAKIADWGMSVKYSPRMVGNRSVIENKYHGAIPNFYNSAYDVAYITFLMKRRSSMIRTIFEWILNGNDVEKVFIMEENAKGKYRPRVDALESLLSHVTPDAILKGDLVKRYTFRPKRVKMMRGGTI